MPSEQSLHTEFIDDLAIVRLNRPAKLNALDHRSRVELAEAIRNLTDGTAARGLIVTGTGRAFCAGDDLSTLFNEIRDEASAVQLLEEFHDLSRAVLASQVPTIAAVNGLAVGGGFEWCLAFDWRIGCPDTVFVAPENGIGLTISNGSSYLFSRLLRPADVTRVVLDSTPCNADWSLEIGLLDSVVERSNLVSAAIEQLTMWRRQGSSTEHHLAFLRPDPHLVEEAMQRENEAWAKAWTEGLIRAGVESFWRSREAADASVALDGPSLSAT